MRRATERNVGDYLDLLGDLQASSKDFEGAISTYQAIIRKSPLNQRAVRRLSELYNSVNAPFETVAAHCRDISRVGMNEIARNTLSDYMRRTHAQIPRGLDINGSRGDDKAKNLSYALLWWTSLSARTETLDVESLPSDWHDSSVELLRKLDNSIRFYDDNQWWSSDVDVSITEDVTLKPRYVLARMIDFLAQRYLGYDSLEMADRAYTIAFDVITNRNPDEMIGRLSPPDEFYQIAGHRAMFYTAYPNYPEAEQKFGQMETMLLEGKNDAYLNNQSAALLRYHTTLGILYAARGKWTGTRRFDNGIFQLDNAIRRSSNLQHTGHLKELLAEGYRTINSPQQARETLLSSSISYLNEDDLESTARVLRQYRELDGPRDNEIYNAVSNIQKLRNDVEKGKFNTGDSVTIVLAVINRLTASTALPAEFRSLQKFKMLTGIAEAYTRADKSGVGDYLYAAALLESRSVDFFPSMSDVVRLDACISSVKKSTPSPWLTTFVSEGQAQPSVRGRKVWGISGTSVVEKGNPLQCSVLEAPMITSGIIGKSIGADVMTANRGGQPPSQSLKYFIAVGANGSLILQRPNAQKFAHTTLSSLSGQRDLLSKGEARQIEELIKILDKK